LLGVGGVLGALILIKASPNGPVLNVPFLFLIIPGILLGTIGSTLLGIAFIRSRYRPRLTPWLLAFAFPLWIVGSVVLGHNSVGLAPLLVAWGATGWRLWRSAPVGSENVALDESGGGAILLPANAEQEA